MSSDAALIRVCTALGSLADPIKVGPEARLQMSKHYLLFVDLTKKLIKKATAREEMEDVEKALRAAFMQCYPDKEFPAIEKIEKLRLFPGTSLTDVLLKLEKFKTSENDVLSIMCYLNDERNAMYIKLPKSQEKLESTARTFSEAAKLHLGSAKELLEGYALRLSQKIDELRNEEFKKALLDSRHRIQLLNTTKLNAAQTRALQKLNQGLPAKLQVSSKKESKQKPSFSNKFSSNAKSIKKNLSDSEEDDYLADDTRRKRPKLTQEEWERQFLARARGSNIVREEEERISAYIGRKEDAECLKQMAKENDGD